MPAKKKPHLFEKAPKGYKWKNVRTLVKDEISKETKPQTSESTTKASKTKRKVTSK